MHVVNSGDYCIDLFCAQAYVETGEKIHQIPTQAPMFTVSWHPKKHLLAYAGDDKVGLDAVASSTSLYGIA